MKLWLDDIRPAPKGWHWAKTAAEAIEMLATEAVESCSLDHDLALEHYAPATDYSEAPTVARAATGYDVVKWMAEHGVWPSVVLVHSMNPVGRAAMEQMIARYKPEAGA